MTDLDAAGGLRPDHVDRGQALSLQRFSASPRLALRDMRSLRAEYSSRGDRVPMRIVLPRPGLGPFPTALFVHGVSDSSAGAWLDLTLPWLQAGVAVAAIDLPLHGERYSPKASERLVAGLAVDGRADPASRVLVAEFVRQSVNDLVRGLDAIADIAELDAARVVCVGFDLGARLVARVGAIDPRFRAAALLLAGGGAAASPFDTASDVARLAPRPVLVIAARPDTGDAAAQVYEAAAEPKTLAWIEAGTELRHARALTAIWPFVRPLLG